jgi:uncharacterized membrane protein YwzB
MSKDKGKIAVGIIAIAGFEVFFGIAGVCMLVSATLDILNLPVPSGLITEVTISRIRASGLAGFTLLLWSLVYLFVFATSIGMFVKKEWARQATLFVIPVATAMSFPFFFPSYLITAEKLRILFGLSRAIGAEKIFASHLLEVITPWWIFVIFFIGVWVLFKKYLSDASVKKNFD